MKQKELQELANYVIGYADGIENEKLHKAGTLLKKWSMWICGQGFVCSGGDNCNSDHK